MEAPDTDRDEFEDPKSLGYTEVDTDDIFEGLGGLSRTYEDPLSTCGRCAIETWSVYIYQVIIKDTQLRST